MKEGKIKVKIKNFGKHKFTRESDGWWVCTTGDFRMDPKQDICEKNYWTMDHYDRPTYNFLIVKGEGEGRRSRREREEAKQIRVKMFSIYKCDTDYGVPIFFEDRAFKNKGEAYRYYSNCEGGGVRYLVGDSYIKVID